jgi:hypothetical protein
VAGADARCAAAEIASANTGTSASGML